jgi:hypothetical protein
MMNTTDLILTRSQGEVVRVVGDSLAYVSIDGGARALSFVPDVLDNYRGETFTERLIKEGTIVDVAWQPTSGLVTSVVVDSSTSHRGGETTRSRDTSTIRPARANTQDLQLELHPDRIAAQSARALRALPPATRKFGKLVDTGILAPGDLLLARDLAPKGISKLITDVQCDGGYHADDARWTHAAMYVGDGENVVEATFDSVQDGGDVRLTSLDEYSEGLCSLRFRRSKYVRDERQGWRVCVRALSRLKEPYDMIQAARMWFNIVIRGRGFFDDKRRQSTSSAVICSTLYADSYNEVTRRTLGEVSGVCVPAWLSVSGEFEDIQAEWSKIDA